MVPLAQAAAEFLTHRRIAVAGVSASKPNAANGIYRRLRKDGYRVYAVNPHADIVEGDACYHSISDLEDNVDGVVVGTHPDDAVEVARACIAAGIPRIWFHRSFGAGRLAGDAVRLCEEAGMSVIAGACPMMFLDPVDPGHKCIKWVFTKTGKLPRECAYTR